MELLHRKDFENVRARWDAFWRGDNRGRPMVGMVVPKAGITPVAKPPYMAGGEGEFGPVIDQVLAWAETHEFLADSIPHYVVEFGSDHFATFLGSDLIFDYHTGTSWATPFVTDWDAVELKFNPASPWWRRTVAFIRELRQRCDGKLLVVGPSLVAGLDALAAVRGIQELLVDIVDQPDKIARAAGQVCAAYRQASAALARELDSAHFGSMTRHGTYARGLHHIAQCDMSCMISPDMYREFSLPCVEFECNQLDAATYHLDGPGAIQHVPALCEIRKLDLIQWMPGTADMDKDWTDLYRQIDRRGKGLVINTVHDHQKILELARELTTRKLFFHVPTDSKEQGLALLDRLTSMKPRRAP